MKRGGRVARWGGCKLTFTTPGDAHQQSSSDRSLTWVINVSAIIFDAEQNHSAKFHLLSAFRLALFAEIEAS